MSGDIIRIYKRKSYLTVRAKKRRLELVEVYVSKKLRYGPLRFNAASVKSRGPARGEKLPTYLLLEDNSILRGVELCLR